MTDKELIELAAKAACINGWWAGNNFCYAHNGNENIPVDWNPLKYDGDALRLAVKLGITIDMEDCCAWRRLIFPKHIFIQAFWGGDYDPCYRRAIVRAAAEIGKNMEKK